MPHTCPPPPPPAHIPSNAPQFGAGYVLTRLGLLKAAGSREAREERCRTLALLGHLLKLYSKWTMLKVGPGGVAEVAEKAKIAVSCSACCCCWGVAAGGAAAEGHRAWSPGRAAPAVLGMAGWLGQVCT